LQPCQRKDPPNFHDSIIFHISILLVDTCWYLLWLSMIILCGKAMSESHVDVCCMSHRHWFPGPNTMAVAVSIVLHHG
jgi:hypothetical protein